MDEDPSESPYYKVHREQHYNVPDEHRKDGEPSPMPAELRGLGPDELVPRAQEQQR